MYNRGESLCAAPSDGGGAWKRTEGAEGSIRSFRNPNPTTAGAANNSSQYVRLAVKTH